MNQIQYKGSLKMICKGSTAETIKDRAKSISYSDSSSKNTFKRFSLIIIMRWFGRFNRAFSPSQWFDFYIIRSVMISIKTYNNLFVH
jgi:hypothetical protein